MINSGFLLKRMETLNWGNFKDWQVFDLLNEQQKQGPLFTPSPNSLLAGINGSGKSTLVDGILVALLPFKQLLRLGVTHDTEAGTKGGRGINDYILGKFSSDGGEDISEREQIFSRKTGVSALLLVFQHADNPQRTVSIGHMWWYAKGKVREDFVSFVASRELSIGDKTEFSLLNEEKNFYRSAREFRRGISARDKRVQVFDKVSSYFKVISDIFGGMSKDDLKLLNQAYYVKSVGQIDNFVRTNMLIEKPNESMDRLIDHVKNAGEISRNIEMCERRLKDIQRILNSLATYANHHEEKLLCEERQRLVRIYSRWQKRNETIQEISSMEKEIRENRGILPSLEEKLQSQERELDRIKTLLSTNEKNLIFKNMELEQEKAQEKLEQLKREHEDIRCLSALLGIKPPSSREELDSFRENIKEKREQLKGEKQRWEEERTGFSIKERDLENQKGTIRQELQFLSEHDTLIPPSLYAIKSDCRKAFHLPEDALLFVGELLTMKPGCESFQRAAEAVLHPISRNLLCLPEHLHAVTKWINKEGLKSNITVKRIHSEELDLKTQMEFPETSILNKIQLRPEAENPFFGYLWNWLAGYYYHRIVTVSDFKKEVDKAVTLEGLVKQDRRTMRKFKENLPFFLGWNTQRRREELVQLLREISDEQKSIEVERHVIQEKIDAVDTKLTDPAFAAALNTEGQFLDISELKQEIKNRSGEIVRLQKGNIELDQLKKKEKEGKVRYDETHQKVSRLKGDIQRNLKQIEVFQKNKVTLTKEIQNYFYKMSDPDSLQKEKCVEKGERQLGELHEELTREKINEVQHGSKLQERIGELERSMRSSPVDYYMKEYQKEHNDPNLHYNISHEDQLGDLLLEWAQAKKELETTGLPKARAKWEVFYNNTLLEAVKTAINDIRREQNEIKQNIRAINDVLKMTNFENLPEEKRYLQIVSQYSKDERARNFLKDVKNVEAIITGAVRSLDTSEASKQAMGILEPFVKSLQEDVYYRDYVTDVRNHFRFSINSLRRRSPGEEGSGDILVETFTGAKKDAKSSAQTTHLAYTLLASSLAYRFHFHDPVKGKNTLRLIILDEFGGKFDNEKPKDIIELLTEMGFQSILVCPMSKADLLAGHIGQLALVHKASASESKVKSYPIFSYEDYEKIVHKETSLSPEILSEAARS